MTPLISSEDVRHPLGLLFLEKLDLNALGIIESFASGAILAMLADSMPLGLIAGLLGMNVGGLPGSKFPNGFLIVIVLMVAIAGVELWYFKRKGWFD